MQWYYVGLKETFFVVQCDYPNSLLYMELFLFRGTMYQEFIYINSFPM
jgi:hypothetical protein